MYEKPKKLLAKKCEDVLKCHRPSRIYIYQQYIVLSYINLSNIEYKLLFYEFGSYEFGFYLI